MIIKSFVGILKSILVIVSYIIIAGVAIAFGEEIGFNDDAMAIISNFVFTAIIIFLWKRKENRSILNRCPSPWHCCCFALAGAVVSGIVSVVLSVAMSSTPGVAADYSHGQSNTGYAISTLVYYIIAAPVAEEVIFRGAVWRILETHSNKVAAAFISCAMFALMHGGTVWTLYAFIVGLIISFLFIKTESLYATIIFHAAFNLYGQFIMPMVSISLGIYLTMSLTVLAFLSAIITINYKKRC